MCQTHLDSRQKSIYKTRSTPVNPIVDVRIDPGIGRFSVSFKSAWEQVQIRILGPLVELAVEHSL